MAWVDKRVSSDGSKRYRVRDRIGADIVTVVPDAGAWKEIANARKDEYEKKKAASDTGAAALVTSLSEARHGWLIDRTISEKTREIYGDSFDAFVNFKKATQLKHFSKDNIDDWRAAMEDGRLLWKVHNAKKERFHRYSPTTIKIMLSSLKDFLRYGARNDLFPYKLVQSIKVKKVPSTRRFLLREEAARLLKACRVDSYRSKKGSVVVNPYRNNRLRKIILFGLYTGMRISEVLNASWKDVTCQEILHRLPSGRAISTLMFSLFIPKAKMHKQRTVAFHPRLARILGAAKHIGQREPIFRGWTENGLGQARRRGVRRAGLGRVRFHDLRHSFVRNYLKSGAGTIAQLREHTGHENLASLDPYSHFANEDVAATIPKIRIQ